MLSKMTFLAGVGVGYALGARTGRATGERHDDPRMPAVPPVRPDAAAERHVPTRAELVE